MRSTGTMAEPLSLSGDPRALLRAAFDAAIERVLPGPAILRSLPEKPRGCCVVVGAGKASAAMAAAVDAAWPDVRLSGVVATRHGHGVPAGRIEIIEAGHPVPDAASALAGDRILDAVQGLGADDLVLALISGGGSATMVAPIEGLTLAEKQAITRTLLASGAPIEAMNIIRRHLSRIKGGRLAQAAAPARVVTLAISDIPGDDPAAIASGPTLADGSTPQEALALLDAYGIAVPEAVRTRLATAATLPRFPIGDTVRLIATPAQALQAAADAARARGVTPLLLGDAIEGESREVARVMAGIARSVREHGLPVAPPALLISGGETTVTMGTSPPGRGGRNTEFLLALAIALGGAPGIWALAADSDGIDGTEDAAGALISPDSLARAHGKGWDAQRALADHDSYSLFDATGDLLRTGPTMTNVNDLRFIAVLPKA